MPNYCENDLYISGPKESVESLLDFMGVNKTPPEFDLNQIAPYPETFRQMDTERAAIQTESDRDAYVSRWGTAFDGFNSGGYDWCIANWGTKWGCFDVERHSYRGTTIVKFRTAWSPPDFRLFSRLVQKFPDCTLSLEFFEEGMGFCGGATWPSKDDYCGDEDWCPGIIRNVWKSPYGGNRGG